MSGLDISKMDLFGKKTLNTPQKPIEVLPVSSKVIQESVKKFDDEKIIQTTAKEFDKSQSNKLTSNPQVSVKNESRAKYDKFVPVTTRISENEYMDLKRVENQIMRNRSKTNAENRERITFNSVMRCLVSNFLLRSDDIDLSEIQNEEILNERITSMFQ